jgi:membrane protease YdiL (CAAX protease family)
MFRIHKDALGITGIQDVASFQDKHAAPAAHPPQHSLVHSAWLHLLPGVLIVLFAIIVGPMVISARLPLLLVPSLWVLCVLIPFELGYLLYQGKKRNGRLSLRGIVLYREPMPMKVYLLLIPALIVWAIVVFTLISAPIEPYLIKTLFSWMPGWFFSLFTIGNAGVQTHTILLIAVLLSIITNPAASFVEELYFRGYLLPRIAHLGAWAPLINTVLFSLYHLFSPWQNIARILAVLPMTYSVAWKKNIFVGIITHCTLDALSASLLLVMLYR